jgi:hypothetical protein
LFNALRRSNRSQPLWDAAGNYLSHPAGIAHFFLVYVAMLAGVIFAFLVTLVEILYSPARQGVTTIDKLIGVPLWLPSSLAAACAGVFFYKRIRHKFAFWAWVPSFILLLWSAWDWHGTLSKYDSTWDTHFGKDCGGSECLYQLFFTVPFYTSVAYSLGAVAAWLWDKEKTASPSRPTPA